MGNGAAFPSEECITIPGEVQRQRQTFAKFVVPPQDTNKMNMLGVSWKVFQYFRRLTKRVPIDLAAASIYRKSPITDVAPGDQRWHTKDICELLIKPITRRQCSYSELLAAADSISAGPANVFVSHAWNYCFEQVCSALETFFGSEHARDNGLTPQNTYFWFDVFSVRQRNYEEDKADPKPKRWWMDTFMKAIKGIGHMVMLAAPWQNPVPLTRSWCLFELYACIRHRVTFDLLLNETERSGFVDAVLTSHKVIYDNLSKVDVARAQAGHEADQLSILSLVKQELGGADAVNRRVFEVLRQWFKTVIRSEVRQEVGDTPAGCGKLVCFGNALVQFALHDEALDLYQRALIGMEKCLGPEHPNTLLTLTNLALVRTDIGDYDGALKLYRRVLACNEKTLGPNDPGTLATVHNIAGLHYHMGNKQEALKLYMRALKGNEINYGPNHSNTLATVHNLAGLRQEMGDYDEALYLFHRALAGDEKTLGPNHPRTLASIHNLAGLRVAMGNYGEALKLYLRALKGDERNHGPDHPNTLATVNSVAGLRQKMGDNNQALKLYQRALNGRKHHLGSDHPRTLTTVSNLASLRQQMDEHDKALILYQWALKGNEKNHGPDHPNTLATVNNLAGLRQKMGDNDEALKLYKRALNGMQEHLGSDHPHTITTVHNLADLHKIMGADLQALKLYRQVLAVTERKNGSGHPDTRQIVESVVNVLATMGDHDGASEIIMKYHMFDLSYKLSL